TVNGITYSVNYGQNDTTATINNALAAKINAGGVVNAAVSGGSLVLTSDANGASTNYTLAASSTSSQPSLFSTPSFSESASGATLTGGADGSAGSLVAPLTTFYSYDVLGNLLQVVQGQQTRTYGYDSLGRRTSSCPAETAPKCAVTTYNDSIPNVVSTDP